VKIRVEASATAFDVELMVLCVYHGGMDGELGSIKVFVCFNLRHISVCILKCVIPFLCVCVNISLVCSVQWC
jgi:hypothetical protein